MVNSELRTEEITSASSLTDNDASGSLLPAVRLACLDLGSGHSHNAATPPDENAVSGLPVLLKGACDACFNTLVNPFEQVFRRWFLHGFIAAI